MVAASAAHQCAWPLGNRSAQQLQRLPFCCMGKSASSATRPINAQLRNDCMRRLVLEHDEGILPPMSLTGVRAAQHLLGRHEAGAGGDPLQGADVNLLHVHILLASALRLHHPKHHPQPYLMQKADPSCMPGSPPTTMAMVLHAWRAASAIPGWPHMKSNCRHTCHNLDELQKLHEDDFPAA